MTKLSTSISKNASQKESKIFFESGVFHRKKYFKANLGVTHAFIQICLEFEKNPLPQCAACGVWDFFYLLAMSFVKILKQWCLGLKWCFTF
jgi:hypothetical protein